MNLPNSSQIVTVPAANAAIINEHGEVLLTRRSAGIREGGKWCLPGGHVEPREKWWDALCREVREETGLIVKKAELLGVYSDPAITITPVPYYQDFYGQFVVVTFLVTKFEGEVVPNDEVDDWDWFSEGNIPDPILRSHPVRVTDAFQYKGVPFVR